jgi:hypothetical protein
MALSRRAFRQRPSNVTIQEGCQAPKTRGWQSSRASCAEHAEHAEHKERSCRRGLRIVCVTPKAAPRRPSSGAHDVASSAVPNMRGRCGSNGAMSQMRQFQIE